nr:MAG TPA: hypothetical protein [Caudoviricetes sp.]
MDNFLYKIKTWHYRGKIIKEIRWLQFVCGVINLSRIFLASNFFPSGESVYVSPKLSMTREHPIISLSTRL